MTYIYFSGVEKHERKGDDMKPFCENCGNRIRKGDDMASKVEAGPFRGCWVCSEHCDRKLHDGYHRAGDDRQAEARQMGLTAL